MSYFSAKAAVPRRLARLNGFGAPTLEVPDLQVQWDTFHPSWSAGPLKTFQVAKSGSAVALQHFLTTVSGQVVDSDRIKYPKLGGEFELAPFLIGTPGAQTADAFLASVAPSNKYAILVDLESGRTKYVWTQSPAEAAFLAGQNPNWAILTAPGASWMNSARAIVAGLQLEQNKQYCLSKGWTWNDATNQCSSQKPGGTLLQGGGTGITTTGLVVPSGGTLTRPTNTTVQGGGMIQPQGTGIQLQPQADAPPPPPADPNQPKTESAIPTWAYVAGAAVLVAGVGYVALRRPGYRANRRSAC